MPLCIPTELIHFSLKCSGLAQLYWTFIYSYKNRHFINDVRHLKKMNIRSYALCFTSCPRFLLFLTIEGIQSVCENCKISLVERKQNRRTNLVTMCILYFQRKSIKNVTDSSLWYGYIPHVNQSKFVHKTGKNPLLKIVNIYRRSHLKIICFERIEFLVFKKIIIIIYKLIQLIVWVFWIFHCLRPENASLPSSFSPIPGFPPRFVII